LFITLANKGETMPEFHESQIWIRTLAQRDSPDSAAAARERLRNAFLISRDRAEILAGEIAQALPDYTVHDISHIDALWEMADLLTGPDFPITPCEAFVLGCSFLVHDLGMGLAAYPEGLHEIQKKPEFLDMVTLQLRKVLGRTPTTGEIATAPPEIVSCAIADTLRTLHAQHASRLAFVIWNDASGSEYRLIEDPEMRSVFGVSIGLVGYSHWWPVSRIGRELGVTLGAPYWCPNDWTVDPLKVACILRTADASHIDARRAPGFLEALRKPKGVSLQHWQFQERINKPQLIAGRLIYTSGSTFPISQAAAWWTCQETISMIDRELDQVDALLADTGRHRLAASGVAYAGDPARLLRQIPTEGWIPVDTKIRIGDVSSLIKSLGGEQLYGDDPRIGLRELIQNAADAVRARRVIENRPYDWGSILIRLSKEENGFWLEVRDDGVGMSEETLTGQLLDFGASYWDSDLARREHPGLHAKGFIPTGQFGIGFFSVFMIANTVRVITRRPEDGKADTRVIEFASGLDDRPLLRTAAPNEQLNEPGTSVYILLKKPPQEWGGILLNAVKSWRLDELCAWLAPAIDVTINTIEFGQKVKVAVQGGDWQTITPDALLRRVFDPGYEGSLAKKSIECSSILRELRSKKGELIGRACILPEHRRLGSDSSLVPQGDIGVVCVGGLRSSNLLGIGGILVGKTTKASRAGGVPVADRDEVAIWASEQSQLIPSVFPSKYHQLGCAQVIRALTGNTGDLPIAYTNTWMTGTEVQEWASSRYKITLIDAEYGPARDRKLGEYSLYDGVIGISRGRPGLIWESRVDWPSLHHLSALVDLGDAEQRFFYSTTLGLVVEIIAKSWGEEFQTAIKRLKVSKNSAIGRKDDVIIQDFAFLLTRLSHSPTSSSKRRTVKKDIPRRTKQKK
jgi:hypothetical protein